MIDSPLHIFHPQDFDAIEACPCTTAGENHWFIASTLSVGDVKALAACILDMQTGEVFPGLDFRVGDIVTLGFSRLRRKEGQYLLVVAQTDAPAARQKKNAVATVQFSVKSIRPDAGGSNIPITAPLTGATVQPTFTAAGNLVGAANATAATMTDSTDHVFNGVQITQNVPPGIWLFQFTSLPAGTGYTFNVTDSAGNSGTTINIKVQ